MPNISQIQVGSTTYDIQASQLANARKIDGVDFNGSADISHYGVSSTAAGTITKTVSVTGFSLVAGAKVSVKFTNAQEAESVLLNVSSTGAKAVKLDTAVAAGAGAWNAGETVDFTYDGTNWIITGVTKGEMDTALQDYALNNGAYENMTVGNAEQLVSTVMVNDQVPYNYRTSGGSADIGDREYDQLVGGTVAWNQLVKNGNFASTSSWFIGDGVNDTGNATLSAADNVCTQTFNVAGSDWHFGIGQLLAGLHQNDVILLVGFIKPSFGNGIADGFNTALFGGANTFMTMTAPENEWTKIQQVRKAPAPTSEGNVSIYIYPRAIAPAAIGDTVEFKNINIVNVTQLFGSTIANYVYTLEQSNAGDGVAWMTKLFPQLNGGYYTYNAGALLSVNTSEHNMTGLNQFDYSAGTAKLLGGYQYQITGTYTSISYSDINGNAETITPDGNGKFTPSNNGTLTVVGGDDTTTCVHLVWDGEMDGTYEPYELHSYPLDNSLVLRGVPKLDANSALCYNGDIYEADGTVTRRFVLANLGDFDWGMTSSGGGTRFEATPTTAAKIPATTSTIATCICSIYVAADFTHMYYGTGDDKTITVSNSGKLCVADSAYNTASAFKTAMQNSGIKVVYEVASPTTETADPFQNPQIVNDFGTEEYVDYGYSQGARDVKVPVGHNTNYANNLRAKLEAAPDSPSGDGDYIVRQTSGQNSYVPLTFPVSDIPAFPTTGGTYTLQVVVSDGTGTASWVSA